MLYGFAHANYGGFIRSGGGKWNYLIEWIFWVFLIPAPIITNILCIRACYRNTKLIREFFKCLFFAILAVFVSGFAFVAICRLLDY
jgi:hypothetical protein